MSATSSRIYIRDFRAAERVEGVFAISNAQLGRTKQDKPFLKCLIGDRTGQLAGRMWSIDTEQFKRLPTEGFVFLEGETQPYQGAMQLIIQHIEPHEPTPEQFTELLPSTDRDVNEMYDEVRAILDSLEHPAARALAQVYFEDEHLMEAFRRAPAAKQMHHAYLGGLLQHTLQLLKLADAICPFYPQINRDIVLLGLFLHDLGKTRELVYDRTFGYSDRGELVGHIVDGAIMLHDKAQQVMTSAGVRLPANLLNVLQHVILSHHTQPEFGAAKIPATPEAILVALLDNLDAKTQMSIDAVDRAHDSGELGGNFTDRHWALGVKLFKPDPLK